MLFRGLAAVAAVVVATPAMAGDIIARPVEMPGQHIRYEQGQPTIEDDLPKAAVSVLPAPVLDHGSLQFKVAVFNKHTVAYNVGVENVTLTYQNVPVACFTKDELARAAKSRAAWSQFGYALLAGAAAAAQDNKTTITTRTPHGGVYRTVIQRPGLSDGQLASVAAGGGAIALSQIGLQNTLAALNDEVLQTTTVDPQSGYGGRVVVRKLKAAKVGELVDLTVTVDGEAHVFRFKLAKA